LALSRAAEAVQRAANPDEVYRAIGDQVEGAGYHAMVFRLMKDQRHLALTRATWKPAVLDKAEALLGISRREARIPLAPDGFFNPVILEGQSVFCERTVDLAARGLPELGRDAFGRLFDMLGVQRSIYAPLVRGTETWGVLCIAGTDLTGDDVHAVSVFANQASIALENARLMGNLHTSREQLRKLAQQVVDAQEEERRRLSRALHDEAGQSLTALGISLDLIAGELPPECDSLRHRIEDAAELSVTTMDRIRGLAQDLRPPALDAVGLSPTLNDACRMFARRTRLPIDYRGQDGPTLEEEANICLYRFLQEALTNIARHAEASGARVTLAYDAETVSLSVHDDGRGFDSESASSDPEAEVGIGLLGMQERLDSLGGWLEIESRAGAGTRVVAHMPLHEAVP
jgi:signal transduction histidine kinase